MAPRVHPEAVLVAVAVDARAIRRRFLPWLTGTSRVAPQQARLVAAGASAP